MQAECFLSNTVEYFAEIKNLGLDSEWLQVIGNRALAAFNQTTVNDATTAPGTYAYLAAVRELRDIFCHEGWERVVEKNVELVTHPESRNSIMVSSGNKDTGNPHRKPKTKNQKGPQTQNFVSFNKINLNQRCLPHQEHIITNISLSRVWIFLYYIDSRHKQVRMELSLPVQMDINDLRVSDWNKRIILDSIDFKTSPTLNLRQNEVSSEPKIELKRKSNES